MAALRTKFNAVNAQQILVDAYKAVDSQFGTKESVTFNGKHLSKAELLSVIAAHLQRYSNVDTARNVLDRAILARDAAAPEVIAFVKTYDALITLRVGPNPAAKADFGIPQPKQKRQPTAQELVVRAQKARATRKARGTLGSRQRARIRGEVEAAPAVVPVAAPATVPEIIVPAQPTNGVAH